MYRELFHVLGVGYLRLDTTYGAALLNPCFQWVGSGLLLVESAAQVGCHHLLISLISLSIRVCAHMWPGAFHPQAQVD